MAYDEKYREQEIKHTLFLENRKKFSLTGVTDVESFNDNEIIMCTSEGDMTVTGKDLHISKLSLDTGEINIEGQVDGVKYDIPQNQKTGFFSKLFK